MVKRLFKRFEKIMVAVTFAESGEYKTALDMMDEKLSEAEDEEALKESSDASETA